MKHWASSLKQNGTSSCFASLNASPPENRQLPGYFRGRSQETHRPRDREAAGQSRDRAACRPHGRNPRRFQPTEEEFIKIFRVLSKAEPELGGSFWSMGGADGSAGSRPDKAKERLDDELKEHLGEERFLEYSKKRDSIYRGLENLAQRFELPGQVVEALYPIHLEGVRTRARYRYDASIPEHLRNPGWLSAQAALVEKVHGYLDERAFETYQNSRLGSWLEGPYDKD